MNDTDMTNVINDLVAEKIALQAKIDRHETVVSNLNMQINNLLNTTETYLARIQEANTKTRLVVSKLINDHGLDRETVYEMFGWELPKKQFTVRVPVAASVLVTVHAANEDEALEMLSDSNTDNQIRNEIRWLSRDYDYEIDPDCRASVEDDHGYVTNTIPNLV